MNFIIVEESEFDQLSLCDHVAGNEVEIHLSLGEKSTICAVVSLFETVVIMC